jgi:hypothetical protein
MRHFFDFSWQGVGAFLLSAAFTVFLAGVTAYITTTVSNRVSQPSVNFKFEPTYPMIIPAEQREAYGDDAIAIKIETDGVLRNAFVRLLTISKKADLSDPMNGFVEPTFGWPLGPESFRPRTIGGQDYILIATISRGKSLTFFLNSFYGADGPESHPLAELEFLRSLMPGIYYMQIALLSDSAKPLLGKFKLTWSPPKIEMTAIK